MYFGGVENKIFDHAVFVCGDMRLVAVINTPVFFGVFAIGGFYLFDKHQPRDGLMELVEQIPREFSAKISE